MQYFVNILVKTILFKIFLNVFAKVIYCQRHFLSCLRVITPPIIKHWMKKLRLSKYYYQILSKMIPDFKAFMWVTKNSGSNIVHTFLNFQWFDDAYKYSSFQRRYLIGLFLRLYPSNCFKIVKHQLNIWLWLKGKTRINTLVCGMFIFNIKFFHEYLENSIWNLLLLHCFSKTVHFECNNIKCENLTLDVSLFNVTMM